MEPTAAAAAGPNALQTFDEVSMRCHWAKMRKMPTRRKVTFSGGNAICLLNYLLAAPSGDTGAMRHVPAGAQHDGLNDIVHLLKINSIARHLRSLRSVEFQDAFIKAG